MPDNLSRLERAFAGAPLLSFFNLAVAGAMCNAPLRLMMLRDDQWIDDEVALDILGSSAL